MRNSHRSLSRLTRINSALCRLQDKPTKTTDLGTCYVYIWDLRGLNLKCISHLPSHFFSFRLPPFFSSLSYIRHEATITCCYNNIEWPTHITHSLIVF